MKSPKWAVKIRRNGGGESVVEWHPTEALAQEIADWYNEGIQSDNYYIEEWDERKSWKRTVKRNLHKR